MNKVELTLQQFEALKKGYRRGRTKRLDDRMKSFQEEGMLIRESLGLEADEAMQDPEMIQAQYERTLALDLAGVEENLSGLKVLKFYDPSGSLKDIDKKR